MTFRLIPRYKKPLFISFVVMLLIFVFIWSVRDVHISRKMEDIASAILFFAVLSAAITTWFLLKARGHSGWWLLAFPIIFIVIMLLPVFVDKTSLFPEEFPDETNE